MVEHVGSVAGAVSPFARPEYDAVTGSGVSPKWTEADEAVTTTGAGSTVTEPSTYVKV